MRPGGTRRLWCRGRTQLSGAPGRALFGLVERAASASSSPSSSSSSSSSPSSSSQMVRPDERAAARGPAFLADPHALDRRLHQRPPTVIDGPPDLSKTTSPGLNVIFSPPQDLRSHTSAPDNDTPITAAVTISRWAVSITEGDVSIGGAGAPLCDRAAQANAASAKWRAAKAARPA